MYDLDEPALEVPCGYCGQPAGAWCVRRSRSTGEVTGRASWLHEDRKRPMREAWRIGWRDGVAQVTHDLDRWAEESQDAHITADLRWAAQRIRASWVARTD